MTTDIFSRIEHSRTADEVVHQIEILVLEGILRVGDRLPGERELAKQFDVSRPILREALKVLEGRGLLNTQHGGGTFVADVIGQVFTRPVMELIARHQKATLDYLEYRREVEAVTVEFAARRATDADKALLTRIITAMKAAHQKDDFEEEASIDVEFHSAIGECAHNIILLHTLRSCYRLLTEGVFYNRAMVYNLPGAREQLLQQHVAIYEAVMAGDAQAGRRAAQAHIDFVSRAMTDAQRSGDWERVSILRLQQRAPNLSGNSKKAKLKQSETAN
ncbi:MAG: FCD domain-containing protein [Hoeflea sp.]|uniref:FadR/GntR family transcriptional regulator n=1 Tax=Hoeflea sp. TaxID=1940281 RepID=UPI00329A075D|tara:strand:+ start:11884 stop:12711 length:828 start_codon:yes stop_codon:yes gene_type:complete